MNASELERLVSLGVAACFRAATLAAPTLDRCSPGMVDADERLRLWEARHDLLGALISIDSAKSTITQAAAMLGEFLEPA